MCEFLENPVPGDTGDKRQYGFSARQTGILDAADNTMVIILLLVYGYLGDRYNKPRLIGFSSSMIALSSFVMALAHFIITPQSRVEFTNITSGHEYINETGGFVRSRVDLMCPAENRSCSSLRVHQDLATSTTVTRAFYILLAGRVIYGVGASSMYTLMVSYIYENSGKHKSPLYLGILHAAFMLGPVTGYLIAGATNRLPVDLKDFRLKPKDPRFIGCWWIGFLFVGALGVIGSVPMFTFPAEIKPGDRKLKITTMEDNGSGFLKYVREFFRTIRNLLTSPLYLFYTVAKLFLSYVVMLSMRMLPRYLEFHFRLPIYKISMLKGGALTVPMLIGSLLGGVILSRCKLRDVTMAIMVVGLLITQFVLVGVMMALHCPQSEYVGFRVEPISGSVNLSTSCSMPCKCDVSGSQPVCGHDGRDYFTPCHAGCTGVSLEGERVNFTNCQCVPGGWAVNGHCLPSCSLVIPYVMMEAVVSLCAAVMNIPLRILIIRAIPTDVKAFGQAFASFSNNLFGDVPGPIISGTLVDLTCQIWQRRCERRGSCLQYNVGNLRALFHGGLMLFYSAAVLVTFVAYLMHRRKAETVGHENDDVTSKLAHKDDYADEDVQTSSQVDVEINNGETGLFISGENERL